LASARPSGARASRPRQRPRDGAERQVFIDPLRSRKPIEPSHKTEPTITNTLFPIITLVRPTIVGSLHRALVVTPYYCVPSAASATRYSRHPVPPCVLPLLQSHPSPFRSSPFPLHPHVSSLLSICTPPLHISWAQCRLLLDPPLLPLTPPLFKPSPPLLKQRDAFLACLLEINIHHPSARLAGLDALARCASLRRRLDILLARLALAAELGLLLLILPRGRRHLLCRCPTF
jgi:hypothetical protein